MGSRRFFQRLERCLETSDDPCGEDIDLIIGVGIDVSKDGGWASPYSEAVALKALQMSRRTGCYNILFTGGYKKGSITEAAGMEAVLRQKTARWDHLHIMLEQESLNTKENAERTRAFIKKNETNGRTFSSLPSNGMRDAFALHSKNNGTEAAMRFRS